MKPKAFKNLIVFLLAVSIGIGMFYVAPVLAQGAGEGAITSDQFFGGSQTEFASSAGLGNAPIVDTIAQIIRIVMGFLGIIAVILMIYGGFLYMTAGGDTTRVEKAKKFLINATIGLVIILSAFAITQFIIGSLSKATGNKFGGGLDAGTGCTENCYGDSKTKQFFVYPLATECTESIQNIKLPFIFSKSVKESTLLTGIVIKKKGEKDPVIGTFIASGTKAVFIPSKLCPKYEDVFCFEPNTEYTVSLNPNIVKSSSGTALSCIGSHKCDFEFTTGEGIDIKSPSVVMDEPDQGQSLFLGKKELLQAGTKDDSGVAVVDFYVDGGDPIFSSQKEFSKEKAVVGGDKTNFFFTDIDEEWDTNGYTTNKVYPVWATGSDCSGNSNSASKVSIVLRAASCDNKVQDADLGETDIDCGGDVSSENYCGSCKGTACIDNSNCASGLCLNGFCAVTPRISQVSPGDGAVKNLITISGKGFGSEKGLVRFIGSAGASVEVGAYQCGDKTKWSDSEIVVQVPINAKDGPLEVITAKKEFDKTNDDHGPNISDFDINFIERPGICSLTPKENTTGKSVEVQGLGMGSSQGTSVFYFGNYSAGKSPSWTDVKATAVVPNINSGKYYSKVFTGDFVCINTEGKKTNKLCETTADCDKNAGEICATSWCSESLKYCDSEVSKCGEAEGKCTSVRSASNSLEFEVQSFVAKTKPEISYIDSGWATCSNDKSGKRCATNSNCIEGATCEDAQTMGPPEQYITIFGTDFGTAEGTVLFKHQKNTDYFALGNVDFPDYCSTNFWSNTAITVKVPKEYQNKKALEFLEHNVSIKRQDSVESDSKPFIIINGKPGASLCSIDPVSGPKGIATKLLGENLGNDKGTVVFYKDQILEYSEKNQILEYSKSGNGGYAVWNNTEISSAIVPTKASTGPVYAKDAGLNKSNSVNFKVDDCRENASVCVGKAECCGNGSCSVSGCGSTNKQSHFAYRISTGIIPENPVVLNECADKSDPKDGIVDIISPSPTLQRNKSEDICDKSNITATFSLEMNEATFNNDNIIVEPCTKEEAGNTCKEWGPAIKSKTIITNPSGFTWDSGGIPNQKFEKNTIYRVTLKGGDATGVIQASVGKGGGHLEEDYSWIFKTAKKEGLCKIGAINVNPWKFTATEEDEKVKYSSQLIAAGDPCLTLSCKGTSLYWTSDFEGAVLEKNAKGVGLCENTVVAKKETVTNSPAKIIATVTSEPGNPTDYADLIIDFTDPIIKSVFPECSEACNNVLPWFQFNTKIDKTTLNSNTVRIYECQNENCIRAGLKEFDANKSFTFNDDSKISTIAFPKGTKLKSGKYYRIVLSGEIKSFSGSKLSKKGSNFSSSDKSINTEFQGDYSWIFRTKDSDISCGIHHVSVIPNESTLKVVGDLQEYDAMAFGEPDSCSETGQALQGSSYTWSAWGSKDDPDNVEKGSNKPEDTVAQMLFKGSIELSTDFANELPKWCSSQCLNLGSTVNTSKAVCGNGKIEKGEECEDGNTEDKDGCSSICLNEGTSACTQDNNTNCCGNKIKEKFEECDDENKDENDGCSNSCLRTGKYLNSICGEGDTPANDPILGGEDCDDNNTTNGDGCSSACLNEGGIKLKDIDAVCGDTKLEENKGEECEDGNIKDGDGCSSRCLKEGASSDYKPPSVCGNGKIETGEECDGEEFCSTKCLSKGSSIKYTEPSFCGNGIKETGEECEVVLKEKASVGGYAIAQISSGAPKEAAQNKGYAVSKITAVADGKEGKAKLALQCACSTDLSCGSASTVGCGTANCCFNRPKELAMIPASGNGANGKGSCRNTAVYIDFNKDMDPATFGSFDADGNGKIEGVELESNIALNLLTVDKKAIDKNSKNCPSGYTEIVLANTDNVLVSAWGWIKSKVLALFGKTATASNYRCLTPITYETVQLKEGQRVYVRYPNLLEKNAEYAFILKGDNNVLDGEDSGVLSSDSVGLCIGKDCSASTTNKFFVGKETCKLDIVKVQDQGKIKKATYESASLNFFSKLGEEHNFVSEALTVREGGIEEQISPLKDQYEWSLAWGSTEKDQSVADIVSAVAPAGESKPKEAIFKAAGNNGEEVVIATAKITVDKLFIPSTKDREVKGSENVTAVLCEKTWPALKVGEISAFPYKDLKTNFSFFYCRDSGADGEAEDLPALKDIIEVKTADPVIKELVFKVENTKDAIGVRVINNKKYLTAVDWYYDQGFEGSVSPTSIDGYSGVKTGTTQYISATNELDGVLYPNIYVISYNQDAGESAQTIFAEILKNWKFNANTEIVTDVRLCTSNGGYAKNASNEFISCSWDGDCLESCVKDKCSISGAKCSTANVAKDCVLEKSNKSTCDAEKTKLKRDTVRLQNITSLVDSLEKYAKINKHCSVTKKQKCSEDANCPSKEICVKSYPVVQDGTFVPSLSTSLWSSWNSVFANQLGSSVPTDPINKFWNNCSDQGEGFDSATCWNGNIGKFVCPDRSLVLGYQNKGDEEFTLSSQLEYTGGLWKYPMDTDNEKTDKTHVNIEYSKEQNINKQLQQGFKNTPAFCGASSFGTSNICGDGIKGDQETCEVGDQDSIKCDVNGKAGFQTVNCAKDCKSYEKTGGACVLANCGNGFKDAGEDCDDGKLNGTYGHCDNNCSYAKAFSCGDGYLAGAEQCDCGTEQNFNKLQSDTNSWAKKNNCTVSNGQYLEKGTSCSFDCRIPGPICGDKEVNGPELCDGDAPQSEIAVANMTVCPVSRVCEKGAKQGASCSSDNDCVVSNISYKCSVAKYQLKRTRVCTSSCVWDTYKACLGGSELCGDGIKNGNEECEDGNASDLDSCTNKCKNNICGDSFVNIEKGDGSSGAKESCDAGKDNGKVCTAEYGDDCTYCNEFCQYKVKSGDYCGDGVTNGKEYCDGSDLPYTCFKQVLNNTPGVIGKTCKKEDQGKIGGETYAKVKYDGCETGFTCRLVGICNGPGAYNEGGKYCTAWPSVINVSGAFDNSQKKTNEGKNINWCDGSIEIKDANGKVTGISDPSNCVLPKCDLSCGSACPTSYQTTQLKITSELEGATPNTSLDLFSYKNKENKNPDVGVIEIPEDMCSLGIGLTAKIDASNVKLPNINVIFVTDVSQMMGAGTTANKVAGYIQYSGKSRMTVAKDSMSSGINELFKLSSDFGELKVGLISFDYQSNIDTKDSNGVGTLFGASNKNDLINIIQNYKPSEFDHRSTMIAYKDAVNLLKKETLPGDKNIIILVTSYVPTLTDIINSKLKQTYTEADKKITSDLIACRLLTTVPAIMKQNFYPNDAQRGYPSNDCVTDLRKEIINNNDFVTTFSLAITEPITPFANMAAHTSSEKCGLAKTHNYQVCNDTLKFPSDLPFMKEACIQYSTNIDKNDCEKKNFAFSGFLEKEIIQMYDEIIKKISNEVSAIKIFVGSASGEVKASSSAELPFPKDFICSKKQLGIPLKNTFSGEGLINYSNIQFRYCPK